MFNHLFVVLQRLLPTRIIGRMVYRISRNRNRLLKNLLIRGFVRLYSVDTTEAEHPVPSGYASFNKFFTRRLQPGARSFDVDPTALCSPVDGTIQQIGSIAADQILQAKGITYSLAELLGEDDTATRRYSGGQFITVYLAPDNYHCIHTPLATSVRKMTFVPGKRLAVNRATAAVVPGLFSGNVRVVCHCESTSGPFALVMVGAMNVASISSSWAGEVLPRLPDTIEHWQYEADHPGTQLATGDTLGQFNLGSTIIIVMPPGAVTWRHDLEAGTKVRVGNAIGILARPNECTTT